VRAQKNPRNEETPDESRTTPQRYADRPFLRQHVGSKTVRRESWNCSSNAELPTLVRVESPNDAIGSRLSKDVPRPLLALLLRQCWPARITGTAHIRTTRADPAVTLFGPPTICCTWTLLSGAAKGDRFALMDGRTF
jgi:hypothetical protein